MSLTFEYFHGNEADQFCFYRIPKVLFKDKMFKNISTDAKVLYGLMLDRMGLSIKNEWFDDKNRVYIIYTITDIMEDLNCADQKAVRLLSELDSVKGIGLIERKRQGLGKPNIIYVKNFCITSQMQNCENHDSREVKITNQEMRKSQSNDNNINDNKDNDTDISNTILSYPIKEDGISDSPLTTDKIRWIRERKTYERLIKDNIDYEIVVEKYGASWLDEIVAIMVDVICSKEPYVRINKQDYPQEVVKSRFLKINSTHIEYIDFALKQNTSEVRNVRAFLITTIYRAFETADNWFSMKVNHDMNNT